MQSTSKKLLACTLAAAAMSIAGAALAGQEPYLATVGADSGDLESPPAFTNPADPKRDLDFYVSPKIRQFTQHRCTGDGIAVGESFQAFTLINGGGSLRPITQPEVCDLSGNRIGGFVFRGDWQARVTGQNQGSYRWRVALPKKPNGPINVVLECGIIKPQQFSPFGFKVTEDCAGYTGEDVVGCSSIQDPLGSVTPARLPRLVVQGIPAFAPNTRINLSAYQNPGSYFHTVPLNGGENSRIMLKACQDKTVVVALPLDYDFEAGDLIEVTLNIPGGAAGNKLDIYCGRDSLKIQGIGEPNC